jgi:beta-lactamase regulating signal transducer with metallopeptidase domain
MRHKLLLACFILLAVLPVMAVLIPEIPVPLWKPAHLSTGVVRVEQGQAWARESPAGNVINWGLVVWASGCAVSLVPLLVGSVRVRKMIRNAVQMNDDVLISHALLIPVTCGLFRPRIVLPAQAVDWEPRRVQAVLLHEQAHMRRYDLAVQLAVHLISALWWFQPLVWVLRRKLRVESELACDEEVVRGGLLPSEYAEELLGVAKGVGGVWTFFNFDHRHGETR